MLLHNSGTTEPAESVLFGKQAYLQFYPTPLDREDATQPDSTEHETPGVNTSKVDLRDTETETNASTPVDPDARSSTKLKWDPCADFDRRICTFISSVKRVATCGGDSPPLWFWKPMQVDRIAAALREYIEQLEDMMRFQPAGALPSKNSRRKFFNALEDRILIAEDVLVFVDNCAFFYWQALDDQQVESYDAVDQRITQNAVEFDFLFETITEPLPQIRYDDDDDEMPPWDEFDELEDKYGLGVQQDIGDDDGSAEWDAA